MMQINYYKMITQQHKKRPQKKNDNEKISLFT